MKRACIITTDADYVSLTEAWATRTTQEARIEPTERLLADLRTLVRAADLIPYGPTRQAAARVRAALGEPEIPPRDG